MYLGLPENRNLDNCIPNCKLTMLKEDQEVPRKSRYHRKEFGNTSKMEIEDENTLPINQSIKTNLLDTLLPNSSPADLPDEAMINKTPNKHKLARGDEILDFDLDGKIYALEAKWAKREKFLTESLRTSATKVRDLKEQLSSIIKERDNLQNQLIPRPQASKVALESMLDSNFVRRLSIDKNMVGIALKTDNMSESLQKLRATIMGLTTNNEHPFFSLAKGEGKCQELRFPSTLERLPEPLIQSLSLIDRELGKPGVNMVGLLTIPAGETNVSKLLHKSPTNVIWVNVGDSPLLVKVKTRDKTRSMLLNPGLAIAIGKEHSVSLCTIFWNVGDLFLSDPKRYQPYALCLTPGDKTPGSWLNALNPGIEEKILKKHQSDREMSVDNFEDTPHILKESDPDLPKVQRNHAGSIRERLERLGVPLKYQSSIRVAPIKGSGLPPCFLESKVTEIVSWLRNLKQLKADLPLPEITSVTPSWETPREGA